MNVMFSYFDKKENVTFMILEVTFEQKNHKNLTTVPSMLATRDSSLLWTAYNVKIIKFQNDRLIDAVILVYHSFSLNSSFLSKGGVECCGKDNIHGISL